MVKCTCAEKNEQKSACQKTSRSHSRVLDAALENTFCAKYPTRHDATMNTTHINPRDASCRSLALLWIFRMQADENQWLDADELKEDFETDPWLSEAFLKIAQRTGQPEVNLTLRRTFFWSAYRALKQQFGPQTGFFPITVAETESLIDEDDMSPIRDPDWSGDLGGDDESSKSLELASSPPCSLFEEEVISISSDEDEEPGAPLPRDEREIHSEFQTALDLMKKNERESKKRKREVMEESPEL